MANWYELGPFTVFDLETTGFSAVRCRIIEIGAVRMEKDGALSRFETLVNPNCPIPPQVSHLTKITNEMVANAPNFTDAAYKFMEFCKGSRLVAHNARFDLAFLQESLARTGLQLWRGGAYDLLPMCKQAFPNLQSYSLDALTEQLGLTCDHPEHFHRAGYDAEMEFAAFCKVMNVLNMRCANNG